MRQTKMHYIRPKKHEAIPVLRIIRRYNYPGARFA
jgi:hypothetical protein